MLPSNGRGDLAVRVDAEAVMAAREVRIGAPLEHASAPQVALRKLGVREAPQLLRGGRRWRLLVPARLTDWLNKLSCSTAVTVHAQLPLLLPRNRTFQVQASRTVTVTSKW